LREVILMAAAVAAALAPGVAGYLAGVEARIRTLHAAESRRWAAVDGRLEPAVQAIARLAASGGKRLRALFMYWAFTGAGGDPGSPIITDAGAALELIHLAALIHDDVMDASALRRGMPTMQVSFAELHRRREWPGDADQFGAASAIVLGDLALFHADCLLANVPAESHQVVADLKLEMAMGQYLDLRATAAGGADAETALRVALYKTARYSVERPLHLGASLAGRLDELAPGLSAYGIPLGIAFQLADDLLGAFGDPAETGKPVGDDARQGKPTLLLATGDRSEVEHTVEHLIDEAVCAVARSGLASEAKTALVDLARFVKARCS
jgi:geranylgeranyl diphosphate synthase type I